MDIDSPIDLRAVFEVIDSAEVITFRFVTMPHRLLFDTRHNQMEGPLLRLVPRAASPEERLKTIKQMRPHFRLPEKISSVWWPKHVHSLADFGAWDRILQRIDHSSGNWSRRHFLLSEWLWYPGRLYPVWSGFWET